VHHAFIESETNQYIVCVREKCAVESWMRVLLDGGIYI
jgi:hypothetical protein